MGPTVALVLSYACCDVQYDFVKSPAGPRLSTIVTKPKNASGRLPAIFFVGWLSCDSVASASPNDGWPVFLEGLARDTGALTMRVDKAGVGRSEGDCRATDYLSELDGYAVALRALLARDDVDPRAIIAVGGSMGGATAPLVIEKTKTKVRGVAVFGTFTKTWYEHMIELERRRLALDGATPAKINEQMRGFAELHSLILHRKLTPAQAVKERPALAGLWYDEPGHLYGRPLSFYQQAQDLNVVAAWHSIDAPVLAMWGETDWIMSREDHQMIASFSKRGRFVAIPKTDHFLMAGERPDRVALETTVAWIKEVLR
jgi:pimeloyl-ACP methyl ester carboxylesterase